MNDDDVENLMQQPHAPQPQVKHVHSKTVTMNQLAGKPAIFHGDPSRVSVSTANKLLFPNQTNPNTPRKPAEVHSVL